ncbi:hypothetical protein ACTJK5_19005 [Agrobacterium sp. 22094]|uniref:hypothetical protein n=1 Tax=Agrobacterium sp. 22094 TaxID=3453872 RepID=UPI003F870B57
MNAQIAVKIKSGPSIMLASGNWFDLLDPWNSEFTIEDIAQGLSNICRYSGQCKYFYSVAEHSIHVCDTVDEFKLEALMHDAAEAFVGDITRPLKQLLPQYKEIEANVEDAICRRFNLDKRSKGIVKAADLCVLAAEQSHLMPPGADFWAIPAKVQPASFEIGFLRPEEARRLFLDKFQSLHR